MDCRARHPIHSTGGNSPHDRDCSRQNEAAKRPGREVGIIPANFKTNPFVVTPDRVCINSKARMQRQQSSLPPHRSRDWGPKPYYALIQPVRVACAISVSTRRPSGALLQPCVCKRRAFARSYCRAVHRTLVHRHACGNACYPQLRAIHTAHPTASWRHSVGSTASGRYYADDYLPF